MSRPIDPNRPLSLTDVKYSNWKELNESIVKLPNDYGIKFDKVGYDLVAYRFGIEELIKLSEDTSACHAVCFANRPNCEVFFNHLEQEHFPPDTPANNQYEYRMFRWHNMMHCIASIPVDKKPLFIEAAKVAELRFQDGAVPFSCGIIRASLNPTKMNEDDDFFKLIDWFPLNSPTVSTLESQSNNPIYEGKGGQQDAQAEADLKLKQILEQHGISWEDHLKRRET